MLERRCHSLLEKDVIGLIRSVYSGDNMGPVPFPGGEPDFWLPLNDKGNGEVNLEPRLGLGPATFTRATTASTVSSTGQIIPVASGVPRSWYWPDTLAYGGYLPEGARTNLCLRSENLATTWTNSATTESVNAVVSPDGATTADKMEEDNTVAAHSMSQTITVVAATAYTFTAFCKSAERDWVYVDFTGTASPTNDAAWFDVANGVVGTTGSNITSATIHEYPNGWWRIRLTFTSAAGTSLGVTLGLASADNTSSYQGVTGSGTYWWGMQLEAGTFASSYIPTTTASVTRNADVLTYPFAGNADATQGTAYAELGTEWLGPLPANVSAIGFNNSNDGMYIPNVANATTIRSSDGTSNAIKTGLTNMATATRKRAVSWGAGGQAATGDGEAPGVSTFDGAMGSTAIAVGSATDGTRNWFGPIKNIRLWKTQVADQTLQLMTRIP